MVDSEAVCGGLIAYTHAVDELIMHRHTTHMRVKHKNMETEARGVPTSHKDRRLNSTWKLPSEAQQEICDIIM